MAGKIVHARGGGGCKLESLLPQYVGLVAPDEKGVEWVFVGKMFAPSSIYGLTPAEKLEGYRPVQIRKPGLSPLKPGSAECGFAIVHPSRLLELSGTYSDADIGRALGPPLPSSPFCLPAATTTAAAPATSASTQSLLFKPTLYVRQPCTLSKFQF